MIRRILENIANFQRRGSNWLFKEVIALEIHLYDYKPLSGSIYIPLPKKIAGKKAVIHIKKL